MFLNISVAFGAWRQFARFVSSFNKWKFAQATILFVRCAALSRDSVSSRTTIVTIVPPVRKKHAHTRRYQMVLRECKWMVLRWRLNRKYRWRRYLSFNQPCIRWRCSFCRHFERERTRMQRTMKLRAPQVHQLVLVYLLVLIPSCSVGCLLQCVPFYRHALSNYWLVDLMSCVPRGGKESALPCTRAADGAILAYQQICKTVYLFVLSHQRPILFGILFCDFD